MILFFFLLTIESNQFLRLSPGVVSQGLGGASVLIDEGLAVFHNPAYTDDMAFNVTLSRWLYSTNYLTCGGTYQDNMFGISYLNYGRIQGYDATGNPTEVFTPYNLCVGIGRKYGPFGLAIKGFIERIDDLNLYGFCATVGAYLQYRAMKIGVKLDNLGKEFGENTSIPAFAAIGLEYGLTDDLGVLCELKAPTLEVNTGISYSYNNLTLLLGVKYLKPNDLLIDSGGNFGAGDFSLTGGLTISVETYNVGYSIGYGHLSVSHQFSVTFVPGSADR
ncbi:MAG: hypothetical protein JSV53_05975 [candidate division WOR-3 bacterium]|nr:MAG: hypothetical protein JSV53_05975 [candidate division WOR-3 bacterium]